MLFRRKWVVSFVAGASLVLASLLLAADEPNFTDQQKIDFMHNAKVTASHQVSKGITGPPRLTLTDGTVTHDKSGRRAAGVQVYGVDERFWKFHGRDGADYTLNPRQVLLSAGLAEELGAGPLGDRGNPRAA